MRVLSERPLEGHLCDELKSILLAGNQPVSMGKLRPSPCSTAGSMSFPGHLVAGDLPASPGLSLYAHWLVGAVHAEPGCPGNEREQQEM